MLQPKKVNEYRQAWLKLKALGYDVIPLKSGKATPFKGWPTLPNGIADIARWDGRSAAVRMLGSTLVVIDLDIRIESLRDAVIAKLKWLWPDFMGSCLQRHSGGVKIAFIGRAITTARTMQGYAWYPHADDLGDNEKKNQVEVFTTNSPRYVGVHGMHSTGRDYGYNGRSILDVPLDKLPEFPGQDLGALIDACDQVMAAQGLIPRPMGKASPGSAIAYDLTPGMVFRLRDGSEITLAALEGVVRAHGRQEGYATLFDPLTTREDRIKANMSADGLALWDTKTEISHRWASARPLNLDAFSTVLRDTAAAHGVKIKSAPRWREKYVETALPKASLHNARLAIVNEGLACTEDVFHQRQWVGRTDAATPLEPMLCIGEVNDASIGALRVQLSNQYGLDFTERHVRDAVNSLAHEHQFNPVVEMLAKAQAGWDGAARLDRMAVDYLNCDDTPLARACARKTMIAAVARARIPGIKFDTIAVLESPEGWEKSNAWSILAGEGNFSDEHILGRASREVQEQFAGVWIYEIADLAGMAKAEIEMVKAFASRQVDRARPAYGHYLVAQPRQLIVVGTTNNDRYLLSQTGNRRFWPLRVRAPIDTAALRAARAQLWGEAAHYQGQGESLVLPRELWAAAAAEQEARRVKDIWEEVLEELSPVSAAAGLKGVDYIGNGVVHVEGNEWRVSTKVLLEHVLGIRVGASHAAHAKRLADCMRVLGWQPLGFKLEGKFTRGYHKVAG